MTFNIAVSAPGTRLWLSFNSTTYNCYVFSVTQTRDTDGNWSSYTAVWSNYAAYLQTLVFGPRPPIPYEVPGSPFEQYSDMTAACQAVP